MFSRHAHTPSRALSLCLVSVIIVVLVSLSLTLTARSAAASNYHVDVTVLNTEIGPSSLHLLTKAIATAEGDGAQALVIEIDTPGGALDAMKSMTEAELNSSVPIITYVSPTGGYAASAGAFVTLAAPIAAMAPTTRIGASSPILSTGADIGSTLKAKLENDLVASIKGIQHRYGRNVDLATRMVTNAASYDDTQAVGQHIVNLEATSLNDLLNQVNGQYVTVGTQSVVLHTAGADVQMLTPSLFDSFYSLLLDPNIIFLLFIVAMIGVYLEISHPGAILPGTVGGIALLLFLFAIGSLSPNWAGLGLMVLAFVLLVLDLRLPTHGVLTIGALISLVIGAFIFFNSGSPYGGSQINPWVVYSMAALIGLISLYLISVIIRSRRNIVYSSIGTMIGGTAIATTPLLPTGRVRYGDEDWAAVIDDPVATADAGSEVRIVAIEGLRLHVQPIRHEVHIDTDAIPSLE